MLEIMLYAAVGLFLVYYLIRSIRTAVGARNVQMKIPGHNTMRGTAIMLVIVVVFLFFAFPTRYMLCICIAGIVSAVCMFIQRSGILENGILYQSKYYPWEEVAFMQLTQKKSGAYMFGFGARNTAMPKRETTGTILFYREQYHEVAAIINSHRRERQETSNNMDGEKASATGDEEPSSGENEK